nr:unnamed protein product [Digitaria exilis]
MDPPAAKRWQSCTDDIAALPEDILLEVLSRVGNIGDLFRFAATCRRWLRRFIDPAFLARLCPGHVQGHRARLLGFFFQETRFTRMAQRVPVSAPSFLPTPGSPLGPAGGALTSFLAAAAAADDTFNYAEPLAARRGIVLMLLVPRTFDLERVRATHHHHLLGLCNPITRERLVLPPLECRDPGQCYDDIDSYAIITGADLNVEQKPTPSSAHFKFSQLMELCPPPLILRRHSQSMPTVCLDGSRFSMIALYREGWGPRL